MHQNNLHRTIVGLVILLALIGCALPAQIIQPAPAKTPNAIETSIAGTLRAVLQQTEQAGLSTSTAIVPTKALTSSPVISSYGTSLMIREDGSREFIDYRAGVQLLFPPNWLAMRVGEPEYYEAWEKEGARNPHLLEAITSIQNLDLNRFRVTAYHMHPEHVLYDNLPKINVVFAQNDTRTLRQVEYDERTAKSPLSGYKFLSSEFQETSEGLQILVIQHQWKSSDASRSYTSLYKEVLFKVPTGTVAIDLFIPSDEKEILLPEYDQIVDSITLFTP
jgi:hypothetical protein